MMTDNSSSAEGMGRDIRLRTGSRMPVIGLGTWQLTYDTTDMVRTALDLGYRMIDTSGDYGTQPEIGVGLGKAEVDRRDIFLVTKIEEDDNPLATVERALHELRTDYLDLVLIHRPPRNGPGLKLWQGLIKAKNKGHVREIGVSNYTTDLIDSLSESTGEVPVVNQIEWSPFGHSDAMKEAMEKRGIVIQAYSPLTRGKRLQHPDLDRIAAEYEKTPAQLMLRWHIQSGTVPLPKSNRRGRIAENFDVFGFSISPDHMTKLDGLNEHYSSLGRLPYLA